FVTGEFKSHRTFLPDDEYGKALDNFVKGCSDMLITDPKGNIFLGKRIVHPQPDWWYVGGRMMPGESPSSSCSRLLKRELSLDIAPERFRSICYNSMAWGMREQQPKSNGTCDVNIVLTVELTQEEISNIVLDPNEYNDCTWVTAQALLAGDYHPALQYSARALLAANKLAEIRELEKQGNADGKVLEALR
ncbi:hypothetical protein GUITHDRAFT_54381, partial [Guillardia theta CCMP2712]